MNVLGVGASCRPRGNSELLVRRALQGAACEGAATRFLRLPEVLRLPCHGCMACIFKGQECPLKDGLLDVVAGFRWADAVVLGAPAYVLGANSVVKNLQDRMIRYGMTRELAGKAGVSVVSAGVPDWSPFSLSQVSLLFLMLGMPVVDQFVGLAQGPGEVVFNEESLERAYRSGAALGRGEKGYLGDEGACPVCHLDLLSVAGPDGPRCLLCDLPGVLRSQGGRLRLEPHPGAEPRLGEARVAQHYGERVLPSGPRFKRRLREIRRIQAELGLGGGGDEQT